MLLLLRLLLLLLLLLSGRTRERVWGNASPCWLVPLSLCFLCCCDCCWGVRLTLCCRWATRCRCFLSTTALGLNGQRDAWQRHLWGGPRGPNTRRWSSPLLRSSSKRPFSQLSVQGVFPRRVLESNMESGHVAFQSVPAKPQWRQPEGPLGIL